MCSSDLLRHDAALPRAGPARTPRRDGRREIGPLKVRLGGLVEDHWLLWLLGAYVVNQACMNLVRPMVSYRALALGVDAGGLGFLSAAFSVAPLVIALRLGRLLDTRGERPFILAGTVLMGLVALGLAATTSTALVFLLFTLFGLGHLATTVATQGMVARGSDERTYDQRFSAFSLSASIGQLVGPAIAGLEIGRAHV